MIRYIRESGPTPEEENIMKGDPALLFNDGFRDPTYQEMRDYLLPMLGRYDGIDFDMEEAIYWYAHDYHGGQFTNLYATLSSLSPFRPGAYSTGLSGGAALDLYTELMEEFGGA